MKREADRARLEAAMADIAVLCWDCPTGSFTVQWDARRNRHRAYVIHHKTCPTKRSRGAFRQWLEYLTGQLRIRGIRSAYKGDDVVVSGQSR